MSKTTRALTVHHLGRSQSERIVWLCEELGLEYVLKRYDRRADNRMAPPAYKALHPIGAAPVLCDGDVVLAESAAICDYLIHVHGDGRLAVSPGTSNYVDYLYWFHFANGTFQPLLVRLLSLERAFVATDNPVRAMAEERFALACATLNERLGKVPFLAGQDFTAADIMTVFSLTTMRLFKPYDLGPWPHVLTYLQRIGARPGYQRGMQKSEPDLVPLLSAAPP